MRRLTAAASGRRLTVVSVGFTAAAAGRDAVGGSEQVLSALDGALVAAGHRSIVVAMAGSTATGELVTFAAPDPDRPIEPADMARQQARAAAALGAVLAREPVDLVHMHGLDFHRCLPPPGVPVLATLHLPPPWYPPEAFSFERPGTWANCVSAAQMANTWPHPHMLPPIPNGVDVEALGRVRPTRRRYALMLARVCVEKGLHHGLDAARAAGMPLLIGGELFPYAAHQDYFAREVVPRLDGTHRFLGPLAFARKRRLLAGAACLLVPSVAAETSSLAAMEAASCGTPVVAFDRGALPEVVEHGRTGFVVPDTDAMAAAIARLGEIAPDTCRAVARERFDLNRMTGAYLARYQDLVASAASAAA